MNMSACIDRLCADDTDTRADRVRAAKPASARLTTTWTAPGV